jgi:HEAT repeat protein
MKKPRIIALLVLVTAFVASLLHFASRAHEPVYQGKSLSVWLENYLDCDGGFTTREQQLAADLAVQHIGTNALPFLIEMISAKDSRLKSKLIDLLAKQRWIKIHILPAEVLQARAMVAFRALGTTAKPVIPELARLLNDGESVAGVLSDIGTESIPILTNALFHTDARVRGDAISALGDYPRTPEHSTPLDPAEQGAIDAATPGIIHLLLHSLKDSDPNVRGRAALTLGFFAKEPALAVPALLPLLDDNDDWPRQLAAEALGRFREQGKSALPALLRALKDKNPDVRRYAGGSIWLIDTEAADKAGVNPLKKWEQQP